jgi:hypothetical protein
MCKRKKLIYFFVLLQRMPYTIKPIPKTKMVKVVNTQTGEVKAKKTTKAKAENQIKLLTRLEKLKLI